MKKRILFSTYYGSNDIANFNCAHGPFSQLRDEVEIISPPQIEFDWQTCLQSQWWTNFRWWVGIDAVFCHRPVGWYGQQIIKAAKLNGVPLWVHHDDDLLAIPETNPYHGANVIQDNEHPSVELSYKEADILTCQSILMKKMLKEKYGRGDVVHLPIALDDRLCHLKRSWTPNNRICWRGSSSHKHDLLNFKVELQTIFDKYQDREFHFFILNPRELGFKVKNLVMHEATPFFEFYKELCEINASYALVLLEDNHFNRVKSHLAWLDHTLAGSIAICPDYPEFNRDGIILYEKKHKLSEFNIPCTDYDENLNSMSWKEIKMNYLNSVTNEVRKEIIKSL